MSDNIAAGTAAVLAAAFAFAVFVADTVGTVAYIGSAARLFSGSFLDGSAAVAWWSEVPVGLTM